MEIGHKGGKPFADRSHFEYEPKHLSSSYANIDPRGQPQVSGFFMKGASAKDGLLQHLREESQKQRLDNITKRLVIPYKNETRKTKVDFFQKSQVGAPKTSMKYNQPSRLVSPSVEDVWVYTASSLLAF